MQSSHLPAVQTLQAPILVRPVKLENVPGGHAVAAPLPAGQKNPAGQREFAGLELVDPPGQKYPAVHEPVGAAKDVPEQYCPVIINERTINERSTSIIFVSSYACFRTHSIMRS